ncbi:SDR family oxidoreductase [Bartonella sp. HY406]|uniref:SDR family oxidoreductase n=1 Tax=Bartonella sp. HY406 TaxID=2979331 RepID=UPI0021C89EB5|nr:SDR family oxidoreductase [Bartonella sp. HY406]UXN04703.1 SDR family oxidoreductase [Bartonella sp. HY406]
MNNSQPVALITGGAKRLGAAIAEDLARHGFQVAIHCNGSQEQAASFVNKLRHEGFQAKSFQCDLLTANLDIFMQSINDQMGPVTLLVNNSSIFLEDGIGNFNEKIWNDHFNLHVKVPVMLANAMHNLLTDEQKGLIINMIDQRVLKLNPNFISYTLSKAALWTATQTLAQALAPRIRVNAIGPGPSLKSPRQSEEDFDKQCHSLLLEHGPKISEFGATIRYLWQNHSITGQMIALDGGQHLAWQTPDIIGQIE